jgi:hypothetical protein
VKTREPGRRLDLILAVLIAGAALAGLIRTGPDSTPPPALSAGPAVYRPDGGQSLGPRGQMPPNALSRLNLGRQVDLAAAPPFLLAALPGLGPKTAEKARADGCLDRRARTLLKDLVNETCARNNP